MGRARGTYFKEERCISDGKRPLGRHSRGWEHNIKMDIQEKRLGTRTKSFWFRIETSGRAVVNVIMNILVS
jgi:hypothetical protein